MTIPTILVSQRQLSDPQVLLDVQAAVTYLEAQPGTAGQRIGVTGFCMGGMYALLAACADTGVSASVGYYGLLSHAHGLLHDEKGLNPARKPRQPLDAVADLGCPLLCFYGDQDEFVPMADVEALHAGLSAARHPAEVVIYEAAGHAFMNDTRTDAYRPETAKLAWGRCSHSSASISARRQIASRQAEPGSAPGCGRAWRSA